MPPGLSRLAENELSREASDFNAERGWGNLRKATPSYFFPFTAGPNLSSFIYSVPP